MRVKAVAVVIAVSFIGSTATAEAKHTYHHAKQQITSLTKQLSTVKKQRNRYKATLVIERGNLVRVTRERNNGLAYAISSMSHYDLWHFVLVPVWNRWTVGCKANSYNSYSYLNDDYNMSFNAEGKPKGNIDSRCPVVE